MAHTSQVLLAGLCLLILSACSGGATDSGAPAAPSSAPLASPSETEPQDEYVPALIGTWDYEYDQAESQAILEDFRGLVDHADRVAVRLAFVDDRRWWLGYLFDGELFLLHGVPEGDGGTYTVNKDHLATTNAGGEALVTYDWSLEQRELTLTAIEECTVSEGEEAGCILDRNDMDPLMRLATEHTFTRSGSDVTY